MVTHEGRARNGGGARVGHDRRRGGFRRVALAMMGGLMPGLVMSSVAFAVEAPPTMSAAKVLGDLARGENYTIADEVRSDGFLQIFTVDSKYGRFTVSGREFLNRRLNELRAMAVLEKMNQSDLFAQSMVKSATSPVRFGLRLLSNPFETVNQTASGVADAFGKIGAGLSNPNSDPDGLAASAVGVGTAKRQLAAELRVDPYTDFKPLADKLTDTATTMALGGLGPKAAFSVVGGGAGMALSYSSTADGVIALVADKTPAELIQLNAQRLRAMGVEDRAAQAFLANDFYTLVDQTRLIDALNGLSGVRNRAVFIERAASAHSRDLAYFLVRRAEMIADYQRASGGMLVQFVSAQGLPINIAADGRPVILAPIDLLAWSQTPLQALNVIAAGLKSDGKTRSVDLRITGTATPAAREGLAAVGWTVTQDKFK